MVATQHAWIEQFEQLLGGLCKRVYAGDIALEVEGCSQVCLERCHYFYFTVLERRLAFVAIDGDSETRTVSQRVTLDVTYIQQWKSRFGLSQSAWNSECRRIFTGRARYSLVQTRGRLPAKSASI